MPDAYPSAMIEQMRAFGLFGATIAPEYGGLGMPTLTYARIVARMSEVWMSLPGVFSSHLMMAAAVQRFGTDEQRRRFPPRFASGELRGGLALTEPDCGTDLQAIRTRAIRDGDHYVINGAKSWITNSVEGSCLALLVKTDPSAEPRHRGMSLFVVEKGPGFRVTRRLEKLGYKGIDSGEFVLEDFRVPAANLIGGSTSPRAASASPRRRSTIRCATPSSARPSARRSASTRRSSSSSLRWPRAARRRAC
jgi:alkylation response protein AidB-like acyl-CoA dehydrogenase